MVIYKWEPRWEVENCGHEYVSGRWREFLEYRHAFV